MPDNGQKKKRGVSYPPYMADAKSETPNERSAGLKYRERNDEKTPSGCPEHGTKFIQAKYESA